MPHDWSLFRTTDLDPSALVVWPTASTPLTGDVLDDIVLGVDEDANLLWAVELTVDGVRRLDDAESLAALAAGGNQSGRRRFSWLPTTTLPEHWHRYRIEPVSDESGAVRRFVQGLVSTATGPDATAGVRRGPRSELIGGVSDAEIAAGTDPAGTGHVLDADALPNQGLRLQRRYLLGRGTDGRPVLWRERRRMPLLGGPVSHQPGRILPFGATWIGRQSLRTAVYQRTVKLTIGANATGGNADDLLQRLEDERIPSLVSANGFIAFYAVKLSDSEAFSTRIFDDLDTLQAENQGAHDVIQQIGTDIDLSDEGLVDGEVGVSA